MAAQDLCQRVVHVHGFCGPIIPARLERGLQQFGAMDAIYMWTSSTAKKFSEHAFVIFKEEESAQLASGVKMGCIQADAILHDEALQARLRSILRKKRRYFKDIYGSRWAEMTCSSRSGSVSRESRHHGRSKERDDRGFSSRRRSSKTPGKGDRELGEVSSDEWQTSEESSKRRGSKERRASRARRPDTSETQSESEDVDIPGGFELPGTGGNAFTSKRDTVIAHHPQNDEMASLGLSPSSPLNGRNDQHPTVENVNESVSQSDDKPRVSSQIPSGTTTASSHGSPPIVGPSKPPSPMIATSVTPAALSIQRTPGCGIRSSKKPPTQPRRHPLPLKPSPIPPTKSSSISSISSTSLAITAVSSPSSTQALLELVSLGDSATKTTTQLCDDWKLPQPKTASREMPAPEVQERDEILHILRDAYTEDPLDAHRCACLLIVKCGNDESYELAEAVAAQCLDAAQHFRENTSVTLSSKAVYLALANVKTRQACRSTGHEQEALMLSAAKLVDLAEDEDRPVGSLNCVRLGIIASGKSALVLTSSEPPQPQPELDKSLSFPSGNSNDSFGSPAQTAHILFVESLYSNATSQLSKEQSSKRKASELAHDEKAKRRRIERELDEVMKENGRLELVLKDERARRRKAEDEAWEARKTRATTPEVKIHRRAEVKG